LKRAIELHHEDTNGPDTLSKRQLDEIAAELGIEAHYIESALIAELETSMDSPTADLTERILAQSA